MKFAANLNKEETRHCNSVKPKGLVAVQSLRMACRTTGRSAGIAKHRDLRSLGREVIHGHGIFE
jgi:hypothetical protein